MSKNIKVFMAVGVLAIVAACGARQPESVAAPTVMAEPTMQKL